MGKNSFVLYFQWRELFNLLDDENAGKAIKAIFAFAESGEVPENLSPDAKMLFALIQSQLLRDAEKYAEVCEKRRTAGALGGKCKAKKQGQEPEKIEPNPRARRFVPPSIEELKSYITEENLDGMSAEAFFDFYESKNWYVGRNKMTNWKSAVKGWHRRNEEQRGDKENGKNADFDRSIYE